MRKVLVTGGAGFVGSHLVEELIGRGYEVVVFDNLSTGSLKNLEFVSECDFIHGDIRNFETVKSAMIGCDTVLHMAALPRITPSFENPLEGFSVNVTGTANVLEAAKQLGIKYVLYPGSSSLFADTTIFPTPPDAPKMPSKSPYSFQKLLAEYLCRHYHRMYGLNIATMRLFNVFGDRMPSSGSYAIVAGIFLNQKKEGKPLTIKGDGTQRRDFTYVKDIVKSMVYGAERRITGTFHLGTGKNHSVNEIAYKIDPHGQREYLPLGTGDYPVTLADNIKARNELDFYPTVDIMKWLDKQLDKQLVG